MNYNVDDIVLFDSEMNTLTHIDTQECVSLTMSQSILLELLLNSNAEIMARDKIIDTLWSCHGINCSTHTLNQYVSVLRKLFAHFGREQLLITLPRVGLRLNPDIHISVIADTPILTPVIAPSFAPEAEQLPASGAGNDRLIYKKWLPLIAILMIVVSGALVTFRMLRPDDDSNRFTFITEQQCEIGLPRHFSVEDQGVILKQAKEIMVENKLSCNEQRIAFFDFYKSVAGQDYGRAVLALCVKGDNGGVISCENYYYRNWRTE